MNPGQTMSMNLLPDPEYVVWIIIGGIYKSSFVIDGVVGNDSSWGTRRPCSSHGGIAETSLS